MTKDEKRAWFKNGRFKVTDSRPWVAGVEPERAPRPCFLGARSGSTPATLTDRLHISKMDNEFVTLT